MEQLIQKTALSINPNLTPVIAAFIGAFFGAFFAFFMHLILKWSERSYERKRLNFVTIVKLQHMLVRCDQALSWNINELMLFKKVIQDVLEDDRTLKFYIVQPKYIQLDFETIINLKHLAYIKDAMDLFLNMDDLNTIMKSLKEANATAQAKLDNMSIPKDKKKEMLEGELSRLDDQIKQLNSLKDKNLRLLSKTQVLAPKYKREQQLPFHALLIKINLIREETDYTDIEDKEADKIYEKMKNGSK